MMDKKLMLSMFKRTLNPAEIVTGSGSLRRLQALAEGKTVLVSGTSAQRFGWHDQAMALLEKGGNNSEAIVCDRGEPTFSQIEFLQRRFQAIKPVWVVALGGGSVIDAAKIAWLGYQCPEVDFSNPPPITVPAFHKIARLIAIPTTAGSGAEASQAAVLKSETDNAVLPYVSEALLPDMVILDPKLTTSLAADLTAYTGMDALSHAVESYVSRLSGRMTQLLSATALRLILDNLIAVHSNPDDLAARENMLVAAYLAGQCQSTASTGLAHALTHAATAVIGAAHGAGNALFLAPAMRWNWEKNAVPYRKLARDAGFSSDEQLLSAIDALVDALHLPRTLADISKTEEKASALTCANIARKALTDVCLRSNPHKPQETDLQRLLESLL